MLLVSGGGIAYLADMVGKKLGKKRLSVFGLRPRQTAALGTICLGVLITIVTISFSLIVSSGMRQSLLHSAEIRKELQVLTLEQQSRIEQNNQLTKANTTLTEKSQKASVELEKRQNDLVRTKLQLQELNQKIGGLQGRIKTLTTDAQRKKRALENANKALLTANRSLSSVKEALAVNTARLKYVSSENQAMQHKNLELVETTDKLKAAQIKLQSDKDELEASVTTLKRNLTDLQEKENQAQAGLTKAQADLAKVQGQLQTATERLAATQAKLDEDDRKVGLLMNISDVSRKQPLIYRINEEVARVKVPSGVSQSAANGAITLLLRRARVAAQQRGATRVAVFDHEGLSGEALVRLAVSQLLGARSGKVVIGRSSLNAFRGEPVSLELFVLPDRLVYLSGQMVAETVIDAGRGDAAIYQQLTAFLQEKVSQKAMKDGMIPLSNSDISFGQVSQSDVLQLIAQLHNANRTIRLQAHATADTYAADALKLEFRLR